MILLTSQKDQLFDIISENELSPSQFELREIQSGISSGQRATGIYFKNSAFYFIFETGPSTIDKHYARYCPGKDSFIKVDYPGDWDLQLNIFKHWVSYLQREISTPDKWSRLNKELSYLDLNYAFDSDKFTVSEFQVLSVKIHILQDRIKEIDLTHDQTEIINRKLDFLLEKAKDLSKFDWKSLFIGTLLNIPIQLGVSEEKIRSLWSLIKEIFNQYLLN